MDDDGKVGEDTEETDNEEIGDQEQEEEHQKARATASADISSRREVEDHNLTHIPFRSWRDNCLRGRGRRSAHKRRHSEGDRVDNRAVTTCGTDYMYLTEEGKEDQRDAEEGTARRSTTLRRPNIVGVDRKTGGIHAHQVKCKGSGDPWIATGIAADREELGYEGINLFLTADQEVTIADVRRQVVAVRSGGGAIRRATAE